MRIVVKRDRGGLKLAAPLHIHRIGAVDENVRHGRIAEQWLQRPKPEHFIFDASCQQLALGQRERGALFREKALRDFADLRARLGFLQSSQ